MQAEFSGGVLVCNGMVTLRRVSSTMGDTISPSIHNNFTGFVPCCRWREVESVWRELCVRTTTKLDSSFMHSLPLFNDQKSHTHHQVYI